MTKNTLKIIFCIFFEKNGCKRLHKVVRLNSKLTFLNIKVKKYGGTNYERFI